MTCLSLFIWFVHALASAEANARYSSNGRAGGRANNSCICLDASRPAVLKNAESRTPEPPSRSQHAAHKQERRGRGMQYGALYNDGARQDRLRNEVKIRTRCSNSNRLSSFSMDFIFRAPCHHDRGYCYCFSIFQQFQHDFMLKCIFTIATSS